MFTIHDSQHGLVKKLGALFLEVIETDAEATFDIEGVRIDGSANSIVQEERQEATLTFNISDHIFLKNAQPPYNIRLIGAGEYSNSIHSERWSPDNPFITMDENGVITYTPRGSYIFNSLVLGIEVGDLRSPPTAAARKVDEVYKRSREINSRRNKIRDDLRNKVKAEIRDEIQKEVEKGDLDTSEIVDFATELAKEVDERVEKLKEEDKKRTDELKEELAEVEEEVAERIRAAEETRTEEVIIPVDTKTIIGDPSGLSIFRQSQGKNGTCAITSAYVTALALGKLTGPDGRDQTYAEFVRRFSTRVLLVGTDPATGKDILEPIPGGEAEFEYEPGHGLYNIIEDKDGNILRIDYDELPLADDPQLSEARRRFTRPSGHGAMPFMYGKLDIPVTMRQAPSITDLIREIEAGNLVTASTDSTELWNNEVNTKIIEQTGEDVPGLRQSADHILWITGIDTSDPDNPVIIVNDSDGNGRQDGAGARYPLDNFLSAWEDSEFLYYSIGDNPAANDHRETGNALGEQGRSHSQVIRSSGYVYTNMPEDEKEEIREEIKDGIGQEWGESTAVRMYLNQQMKNPKTMFELLGKYPETGNLILTQLQTSMSPTEFNQWRADSRAWVAEENGEYQRIKDTYGIDPDALEIIEDTLADE